MHTRTTGLRNPPINAHARHISSADRYWCDAGVRTRCRGQTHPCQLALLSRRARRATTRSTACASLTSCLGYAGYQSLWVIPHFTVMCYVTRGL